MLSAASQRAQQARGGRAPIATEYGARRWHLLHRAHQRCGTPPRNTAEHAQCAGHRRYFRWSLLTSCVAQPSTLHQGRGCVQSTSSKAQVWYRGFAVPRHLRRAVRLRPGAPVVELHQSCRGAEQRTGVLSHSECNVVLTASALLGPSKVSSAEADASGCALIRRRLCFSSLGPKTGAPGAGGRARWARVNAQSASNCVILACAQRTVSETQSTDFARPPCVPAQGALHTGAAPAMDLLQGPSWNASRIL